MYSDFICHKDLNPRVMLPFDQTNDYEISIVETCYGF